MRYYFNAIKHESKEVFAIFFYLSAKKPEPAMVQAFSKGRTDFPLPLYIELGGGAMANGTSGEGALLLAVAVASRLSQGRSSEEINYLSAFFSALGENLALMALTAPSNNASSSTVGE